MEKENYILLRTFCLHTRIDDQFVRQLNEYGLIIFLEEDDEVFINENDIADIEKFFRLHKDLNINLEGLDAISQMLNRIHKLESEMNILRKKLRLYE